MFLVSCSTTCGRIIQVSFICLTLHWIETSRSEWTVKCGTAGCEIFEGSHTGARIGAKLTNMLEALGIENQVVSMTTDTAANMKNGVIVHMSPQIQWLGCGCHKTELTVQKFVNTPGLKESLKRFSKIAGHLHKSALSLSAFFQAQKVSLQVLLTLVDIIITS